MGVGRYSIDESVRRVGGGRVLIGGSPLKLFRLSEAGARVVDLIESGDAVDAVAGASMIDRLLDAGAIHPMPEPGALTAADVTVVIPAYARTMSRAGDVENLAESLANVVAAVVVVDDCSPEPIEPSSISNVLIRRLNQNGGPGAARSAGLAQVATPLVAFVDTDVSLPDDWLGPLLAHFNDPLVALVAPRVASTLVHTPSVIERYESVRSPLDLGPAPARVRAGTRISYVPSACVVSRVEALNDVGGFDPALRLGEDVDLVWRLDEGGWRLRYEPGVVVHHEPRPTFAAWARQRFDYGSSAAALERRHPGALAPVRVSGWSLASWTIAVAGWPVVGGTIAAATTALLARKLRHVPDGWRESVRLAGLGHLYAGRSLASGLTRAWWPITVAAALVSRRARRAALAAAVLPPLIDWLGTRPPLDLPRYVALRLADDASYGAGVWSGAIRARSAAALVPDLTSWPATKRN